MVHSTYGLFLTCTQESHLYLLYTTYSYLVFTKCTYSFIEPLAKIIMNPYLLGGPVSCLWGWIPIHLVPCLVATAPPFGFCPFHPFPTPQPTLHYFQRRHQQSYSSSSGTLMLILSKQYPTLWMWNVELEVLCRSKQLTTGITKLSWILDIFSKQS